MKTFNYLMAGGLFFICLAFQSCLDDDDSSVDKSYPNALVTVKQDNDKSLFLQLDDKTKLFPVNMKSSKTNEWVDVTQQYTGAISLVSSTDTTLYPKHDFTILVLVIFFVPQ